MGLAGGLATNGVSGSGGGGGTVTSVTNADGYIGVTGTTSVVLSEGSTLTSALAAKAPLASPTFTGTVTVPTTVNSTDAAQKAYVDGVAAGLAIKASVQEATAVALPTNTYLAGVITITATGTLTVDGVAVALNDRVLVKNEVAAANNGIYLCTTFGTTGVAAVLTRSTDMNTGAEVPGAFTFVEQGTVNAGAGFVVAGVGPYTIGVTAIVWTQFSGAGEVVAGTGLTKTGNTLAVDETVIAPLSYVDASIKAVFSSPGVQAVKTGQGRYYVINACTILGAIASVGTAPTGATFIIDVLKNGTTIYTGGTNRPTISASAFVSATTIVAPAVTALAVGDYLTVNVAQIGSTIPGSDLTVIVFAN